MSSNGEVGRRKWICIALDRYEGQLTRYAQRLTGDTERARDVVQEMFLRLCRHRQSELDGHLAEWLFAVCRNKAIDVCHKESRMTTLSDQQPIETESHEPAPLLSDLQRTAITAAAEQAQPAGLSLNKATRN